MDILDHVRGAMAESTGLFDGVDFSHMGMDPTTILRSMIDPVHGKPKTAKPAEVRREAGQRSGRVLAAYRTLAAIVERHEATIEKRWAKRNRAQRQRILLDAWPDMPLSHRPDINSYRLGTHLTPTRRSHFLWPSINQEDLLKPKTLPLFLHARGRYHPSQFAGADRELCQFGFACNVIRPVFVEGHIMVLKGVSDEDSDRYGKVMGPKDDPRVMELMNSRRQYYAGEGLVILEAQERVLNFLIQVCTALLPEIPLDSMTSDKYPVQPAPQPKGANEIMGFSSLVVMAEEAPYRLPARLDIDRVISVLEAKVAAAIDHIWLLREDPGYFHECLVDSADHVPEILWGNPDGRKGVHWPTVLQRILCCEVVRAPETFAELRKQAVALKALQ